MKIKVGIFFGGSSRDRERAYAGGRAVYEALDRTLFDPVPIFVDSRSGFIALDWPYLYKREIRQFYPPMEALRPSPNAFQVYRESLKELPEEEEEAVIRRVGRPLKPQELPNLIQVAFLVLPGRYGAGGQIQQLLRELDIPFTGAGEAAGRLNHDRIQQKKRLVDQDIPTPRFLPVDRDQWLTGDPDLLYREAGRVVGFPMLIRPAHQPAGIGLSLVDEESDLEVFTESVNRTFFRESISVRHWKEISHYDKIDHLRLLTDPRDGLGFPLLVSFEGARHTLEHPEDLLDFLNRRSAAAADPSAEFLLESKQEETSILMEEQLSGQYFSCLVVGDDSGEVLPLLPVVKPPSDEWPDPDFQQRGTNAAKGEAFDLPASRMELIRQTCAEAFKALDLQAFAKIDGLITQKGQVYIRDADTAPGFQAGAFLYRQIALTGLSPTQSLTFLIRSSLLARTKEFPDASNCKNLLDTLDEQISLRKESRPTARKIALLIGGESTDKRLALEHARRLYWLLSGAAEYRPLPLLLPDDGEDPLLFHLPPSLLFEDDLNTLHQRLGRWSVSEAEEEVRENSRELRQRYGHRDTTYNPQRLELSDLKNWVSAAFIAVLGAPAGDGTLQARLSKLDIPHTGARPESMQVLQNRYRSLQSLQRNGIAVPKQMLLTRTAYEQDPTACVEQVERELGYPLQAMPADEHYPAAEMMIENRDKLSAYCKLLFRPQGRQALEARNQLKLRSKQVIPRKPSVLFQAQVHAAGARQLLPLTCGLLTSFEDGKLNYELLEPSERITNQEFLTLKDQYQLDAGGCITPARLAKAPGLFETIEQQIRDTFEKSARILQMEGYGRFEGWVRIFDNKPAETIVTNVQANPPITEDQCLPAQAVHRGYSPLQFIDKILIFAIDRKEKHPSAVAATASATAEAEEKNSELHTEKQQYGQVEKLQNWLKETFEKVWNFLKSPFFLKNLGLWLVFLLLLFLGLNFLLDQYTHHGESLQVHKYEGLKLEEAVQKAGSRSFEIVVNDSVYREDMEPRVVLEQTPDPFSRVKENRRIYVVISRSTAPEVLLPSLEGAYNYDAYKRKLMQRGLKARIIERQFDNKLEENTILYFYHDGQRITESDLERGIKVPKGSLLEFVVTERLTEQAPTPDLRCKRFDAASFQISANELVIGEIIGSGDFVYRQDPAPGQMIRKGSQINLYLTETRPADCFGEEGTIEEEEQFED